MIQNGILCFCVRRAAILAAVLLTLGAGADAADVSEFQGTWVGEAKARNLKTGVVSQRDLTTIISKHRKGGFMVDRVAVILVDGRRNLPGVKRRITDQIFEPSKNGKYYAEIPKPNPFKDREDLRAIDGDAVGWATLQDDHLLLHSFAVLDDGSFELQTFDSSLTETGMTMHFERVVDGEIVLVIDGSFVRVK